MKLDYPAYDPLDDMNATPAPETLGYVQPYPGQSLRDPALDLDGLVGIAALPGYNFGTTTQLLADLSRLRADILNRPGRIGYQLWQHVSEPTLRQRWRSFGDVGQNSDVDIIYRLGAVDRVQVIATSTTSDPMTNYTPAAGAEFQMRFRDLEFLGDKRGINTQFRITSLSIILDIFGNGVTTNSAVIADPGVNTFLGEMDTTAAEDHLIVDDAIIPVGGTIILRNQSNPAENGVYGLAKFIQIKIGVRYFFEWIRLQGFDLNGAIVYVRNGANNGRKTWRQITPNPVVGTDPIVWELVPNADPYGNIAVPTRVEFAGQSVAGVVNRDPPYASYRHDFAVPIDIAASPLLFAPQCFVTPVTTSVVPNVTRTVIVTLENIVPEVSGNASGGSIARVISSQESDWRRLRVPIMRIRDTATPPIYLDVQNNMFALDALGGGVDVYWRSRQQPTAYTRYGLLYSAAEAWKLARNLPSVFTPASINTLAPMAYVRGLHAKSVHDVYPHAEREDADWSDYDEFTVMIPQGAEVAKDFDLPPLRNGLAYPVVNSVFAAYYKIPLPGAVAQRLLKISWDNFEPDPALAKTFTDEAAPGSFAEEFEKAAIGTQSAELFHDMRLTDASRTRFWYRDCMCILPQDLAPGAVRQVRRFPQWTIEQDGDDFFLILLIGPQQQVATSFTVADGYIYTPETFTPSGNVTAEQYRDFYLRAQGVRVGNWADYIAPYRWFNTADFSLPYDGPIALWTVGKLFGGDWTPGTELKLHLPKFISQVPTVTAQLTPSYAYDATIRWKQSHFPENQQRHTEIHDVETIRNDRKWQCVTFQNGVAKIHLYPSAYITLQEAFGDVRLYKPYGFSNLDGGSNPGIYDEETIPGWQLRVAPADVDGNGELVTSDYELALSEEFPGGQRAYTLTITLKRTDGYANFPGDGEFRLGLVTFRTRAGAKPELQLEYGTLVGVAYPYEFVKLRRQFILPGQDRQDNFFYYNEPRNPASTITEPDAAGSIANRWIQESEWPLVYQRVLLDVAYELTAADRDFAPVYPAGYSGDSTIAGKLVTIRVQEDARVRFRSGYRSRHHHTYAAVAFNPLGLFWSQYTIVGQALEYGAVVWAGHPERRSEFFRQSDGVQYDLAFDIDGQLLLTIGGIEAADDELIICQRDAYHVSDHDCIEGTHIIPPVWPSDADRQVAYLIEFEIVSVKQNFEVRSVYREFFQTFTPIHDPPTPGIFFTGAVPGPTIKGWPMPFHFTETWQLLKSYIAAGRL